MGRLVARVAKLARGAGHRPAGDRDRVASPGLSLVLDLESAPRQTTSTGGPPEIRDLIRQMSRDNPLWSAPHTSPAKTPRSAITFRNSYCPTVPCSPPWGEERIANE